MWFGNYEFLKLLFIFFFFGRSSSSLHLFELGFSCSLDFGNTASKSQTLKHMDNGVYQNSAFLHMQIFTTILATMNHTNSNSLMNHSFTLENTNSNRIFHWSVYILRPKRISQFHYKAVQTHIIDNSWRIC